MAAILHPDTFECAPAARLQSLGLVWRTFAADQVVDLTPGSVEVVYLMPFAALRGPEWPKLRVRLAQSSRLFLAYVAEPVTVEIVECLRDGAHDVLSLSDSEERWQTAIRQAVENQKLWLNLYGGNPLSSDDVLIGRSPAIERLRQTIQKLGPTDVCVLITGESGVGKERVASALHQAGRGGPFVAFNCAAIPKDLLEAELFGVEKGAFTGALKTRPGLVEQAAGGTLFLDEVGEMEPGVQPKLLRFLEMRTARRVGGEAEYKVKTRVIAATNRNLEVEIAERRFRADLYYRLAEIILQISPLRTRHEDIPELARKFLRHANERFGKNFELLEPGLIERFQQYDWPGNVRELKSAVDRLALLFDGPVLRASWWDVPESPRAEPDAPAEPKSPAPAPALAPAAPALSQPGALPPNPLEKLALARRLLSESSNNYTWVAGQLGINSSTLWRWRKSGKV